MEQVLIKGFYSYSSFSHQPHHRESSQNYCLTVYRGRERNTALKFKNLHSRFFIIKWEGVKEEDKCGYGRLSVRGHVRAINYKTEGKEKEMGMGVWGGGG